MIENVWGELLDTLVLVGLVSVTGAVWVAFLAFSNLPWVAATARRAIRPTLVVGVVGALVGVVAVVQVMSVRVAPMSLSSTLAVVFAGAAVIQLLAAGVSAAVRAMLFAASLLVMLGALVFLRMGDPPSPGLFSVALVLFAVFSRGGVLRLLVHPLARLGSAFGVLVCFALPLVLGPAVGGAHIRVTLPVLGAVQTQDLGRVLLVVWLADSLAAGRAAIVATDRRCAGIPVPDVRLVAGTVLPAIVAVVVGVVSSDFGPALVVASTTLVMLAVAGAGRRYFVTAAGAGAVALAVVVLVVGKIRVRIDQMTDPFPTGATDLPHTGKNLLALAHGGVTGLGLGRGMPTMVPESRTDSVLAALGHEMGVLSVACVLALVLAVALAALWVARRASSDRDLLLATGLGALVLCQALVVAGGVLTVIPFTGMPVPFFSTSGSSLFAFSAALGLLVAIAREAAPGPVAAPGPARRLSLAATTAVLLVGVLTCAALRPVLGADGVMAQAAGRDPLKSRIEMLNRGRIVTQDGKVIAVTATRMTGDRFRPLTVVRSYPGGGAYAAVLGHVSVTGADTGLEKTLGERLRCRDPRRITGNGCPTVALTIRSKVQDAAARALQGRTGAVIAVDLRSGDVLAYLSWPQQDPAVFGDPRMNAVASYAPADRVAGATTMPGSVAKVAVGIVALSEDVAPLGRAVASYPFGGSAIGTHDGQPCGGAGIADALARSCNPEFAHVGAQLNSDRLADSSHLLLNQQTTLGGVPIAPSRLVAFGDDAYLAAAGAIGLGNAQVTPLAITQLTALVARGGRPLRLRLVEDASGDAMRAPQIDGDVVGEIQRGMRDAVEYGTAYGVPGLNGLDAAAKTGTADFAPGMNNAWFTTYAPYDEPRFAVTVLLQPGVQQTPGLAGGRDAGPIAAKVLAACNRWAR